ncbi:MAG TPA: FlgD immunoglobulin-like domain containing protein, partial [Candidatus Methylomirabilis sp.]|nr:FlgD immunoglobulin-like domain containing protein [Candidatus Methylomirabilis sp.]
LGVTYLRDIWENTPQDSLTPNMSGAQGTRIVSEPFPLAGDCPGINRFDALQTSLCAGTKARAWLTYPNSLIAAVERRDSVGVVADTARSILLGASLEEIPSAVRRNLFLYRTLVEEFEIPMCYVTSGVDGPAAAAPALQVRGAAPNPFNPSTAIRFTLGRPSKVRIQVFDVSGALVRVLVDGNVPAGEHRVLWDGRDGRGRDLASGAYFYRIEAAGASESRKLILLR